MAPDRPERESRKSRISVIPVHRPRRQGLWVARLKRKRHLGGPPARVVAPIQAEHGGARAGHEYVVSADRRQGGIDLGTERARRELKIIAEQQLAAPDALGQSAERRS